MPPASRQTEPSTSTERGLSQSSRHGSARISTIVVLIAILAVFGTFYARRESKPPLFPDGDVLVVLGDFENRTGNPLFDDSLNLAFRTGMEQSKKIDILSHGRILAALERMERDSETPIHRKLGIEIGQQEGARAFIGGTIERAGSSYSLTASVVDPRTQEDLLAVGGVAETQNEILKVLQQLVREIRSRLA